VVGGVFRENVLYGKGHREFLFGSAITKKKGTPEEKRSCG